MPRSPPVSSVLQALSPATGLSELPASGGRAAEARVRRCEENSPLAGELNLRTGRLFVNSAVSDALEAF